jgi:hypothetical protein
MAAAASFLNMVLSFQIRVAANPWGYSADRHRPVVDRHIALALLKPF